MRNQLVLKFQCDSLANETEILELLDVLMHALTGLADVDHFHVGNSGTNIFIWTDDPRATFERARLVLEKRNQLEGLTAAYRVVDSRRYTVLWP